MTRTGFRNLALLILACLALSAVLIWLQVQKSQERTQQLQASLLSRQSELANLTFLVAAQERLDTLTLDERQSTQLDVLKYLGLQKLKLDFRVDGRESRAVGDTTLIVRNVTVQSRQSFAEVMALIDKLFGGGKFTINTLTLQRGDEGTPEGTALTLQGRLFSLQKQGELEVTP